MQDKLRNFYDDFAQRISFIRQKRGLTLGELADGAASTAKSWEAGSVPQSDKWEAVSKRLGLSISFVFLGKPVAREDFDFIAKFADEIGRPDRAILVFEEPESMMHPGPREDPGHYGTPEMIVREINSHLGGLLAAAGTDPTKLGWLLHQLREHVNVPKSWEKGLMPSLASIATAAQKAAIRGTRQAHQSPPEKSSPSGSA